MKHVRTLNVASDLIGMIVVVPDTGERLGKVADLIIHPTKGKALGLILTTPQGREGFLTTDDFFIFSEINAVLAAEGALSSSENLSRARAGGLRARRELVGTKVVTQEGKLLGYVSEVYVGETRLQVIYRIRESTWQRIFSSGFFLTGDVPYAYSQEGGRLFVTADAENQYAFSSLNEAIAPLKGKAITTERPPWAGRP